MKAEQKNVPKTPQQILKFYKTKYPILKPVELRDIDEQRVKKYHGYALFNLGQNYVGKGKTRQVNVVPYAILLNKKLQQNIYVLLHEISHCISPHVERRFQGEWVYMEHERQFYVNLMEIIKIANENGIYHKQFKKVEDLMKFDQTV